MNMWAEEKILTCSSVRWKFSLKLNGWAEPGTMQEIICRPWTMILFDNEKTFKRHNKDTEGSYTACTRGRRNPELTCHRRSASSHAQSCLARLQSASEIWGYFSDAKPSIPWWRCSCSRRWGPLKSPHSERKSEREVPQIENARNYHHTWNEKTILKVKMAEPTSIFHLLWIPSKTT